MKHQAISVDNPESFKESILDVVQWTESTICDEFDKVMDMTGVTEDAGITTRLLVRTCRTPDSVSAWAELPVYCVGRSLYKRRLDAAAKVLARKFHVEQSQRQGDRDEITVYRISIRYEYSRPV